MFAVFFFRRRWQGALFSAAPRTAWIIRIEETGHSGDSSALFSKFVWRARTITCTGAAFTWLGVSDASAGLFTERGLTPDPHTVSIEEMCMRDVNGRDSWMWLDSFESKKF